MPEHSESATDSPAATASPTLAERASALLIDHFGDAISEVVSALRETTVVVNPAALVDVCLLLRDEPSLRFALLEDITAVDWQEREPRFDVVYHLISLQEPLALRLKARVGGEDDPEPSLPSVKPVWPTADWFELEVYDLFGIRFTGRDEMRRLLMPNDWVGNPLRKDYPLSGFALPDPHWGGQTPLNQPLPPGLGQLTLRTADGSERPNLRRRSEDEG